MRAPRPNAISQHEAGSGTSRSELAPPVRNGAEKLNAPLDSSQLVTGTFGTNSEGLRPPGVSVSEMKNPLMVLNEPGWYSTYRISLMLVVPGSRNAT